MCELSLISRDLEHAIGHGGWIYFPRFMPPPSFKDTYVVSIKWMKTSKGKQEKCSILGDMEMQREKLIIHCPDCSTSFFIQMAVTFNQT